MRIAVKGFNGLTSTDFPDNVRDRGLIEETIEKTICKVMLLSGHMGGYALTLFPFVQGVNRKTEHPFQGTRTKRTAGSRSGPPPGSIRTLNHPAQGGLKAATK